MPSRVARGPRPVRCRRGAVPGRRRRPARGRGAGHRREEQRAQADGGRAAGRGPDHADATCRDILDVEIMAELLRRLGCDGRARRRTSATVDDRRARPSSATRPTTTWCAGCAPRSACSARCSPAAARPRSRCRAATRSAPRPLDMHIAGLSSWAPTVDERARLPHRQGAATGCTGAHDLARLPERRRHREPADGRGAGRAAPRVIDNAAREPEIVDLCQMLQQMGARDRRRRHARRWRSRASTGCAPTTHDIVPDRIVAGTWAFAAAMTRGDVTVARRARRSTSRSRWTSWRSAGAVGRSGTDDGFRVVMDRRPARGRRRDAALPGLPHRPAAAW